MKYIVLIVVSAITFLILMTSFNESRVSKYDAQARLVVAQGQARLDSAQAFSTIMMTALPYLAIIFLACLMVSVFLFAYNRPVSTPQIEHKTQIIILPVLGNTPREIYRQLPEKVTSFINKT